MKMKQWQRLRKHPELWEKFFVREKVITAIRRFFIDRGFHEIDTPNLTGSLPPESYLEIFDTTLKNRLGKKRPAYLATSPEPFLKKLLVAGVGNCFCLTKSFRNGEDMSKTHFPEFTILEWYRPNADYKNIMTDCEDLIQFINTYITRTKTNSNPNGKKPNPAPAVNKLQYQGKSINLSAPWERLSVSSCFHKWSGIDTETLLDPEKLFRTAAAKGYKTDKNTTWEEVFNQIFLNEIEPHLGQNRPCIVYDYPVQLAALSKKKETDKRFAERFEFYIAGLELGDAYSELTDWKEQLARFKSEQQERKGMGKVVHPIDMDFIEALKIGMPPSGGIAVGVDRLVMLFSDASDIAQTSFFPPADLFE